MVEGINIIIIDVEHSASTEIATVVRDANQEELVTKYLSSIIREPDARKMGVRPN